MKQKREAGVSHRLFPESWAFPEVLLSSAHRVFPLPSRQVAAGLQDTAEGHHPCAAPQDTVPRQPGLGGTWLQPPAAALPPARATGPSSGIHTKNWRGRKPLREVLEHPRSLLVSTVYQ